MNWDLLIQLLVNGFIVGMLYGVVAMGFTLIYKSTQVVNFAQGEFLLIGAWICWFLLTRYQVPFWLGFPITLAFMMILGLLVQVIVLRPMLPREELFVMRSACGGDIRTLCAGVAPGGGRIMQCIANRAADLSPACKDVLVPFMAR